MSEFRILEYAHIKYIYIYGTIELSFFFEQNGAARRGAETIRSGLVLYTFCTRMVVRIQMSMAGLLV